VYATIAEKSIRGEGPGEYQQQGDRALPQERRGRRAPRLAPAAQMREQREVAAEREARGGRPVKIAALMVVNAEDADDDGRG